MTEPTTPSPQRIKEDAMNSTTDLNKFAANLDDRDVINLMVRMSKNGQAAERRGDTVSVAEFELAWNTYHAEAVKRGLVTA